MIARSMNGATTGDAAWGRTVEQLQTSPHSKRDADRKRFSRIQALAALQGFAVDSIEADDGTVEYCITKWALTRRANSLDALAETLLRMGVAT